MPVNARHFIYKSFIVSVLITLGLSLWFTTSVPLTFADEPNSNLYVDHQYTSLRTLQSGSVELTLGFVNKGSETLVISEGTTAFKFVENSVILDNDLTIKENALITHVISAETWRKHVGSSNSQEMFGRIVENNNPNKTFILKTDVKEFNLFNDPLNSVNNDLNIGASDRFAQNIRAMVSVVQLPVTGVNTLDGVVPGIVKTITIIPNEPLGAHKRCTVVQTGTGKTSLACDDGEQITIEKTGLSTGTNAVILVHPENPTKVISTAETLMERMNRFQALTEGQENPELSGFNMIKINVDKDFYAAQELAKSKAPPEVQALMTRLKELNERITDLAGLFKSKEAGITVSAEDISRLASMLREFAAAPDKIVDVMIDGYEDDESRESKEQLKTLIKADSSEFFSDMTEQLLKAAQQLDAGNLEQALYILETATAADEDWEKNTVIPLMTKYYEDIEKSYTETYAKEIETLRQDANVEIETVEKLLQGDTTWIDQEVKTTIETTLKKLKESLNKDDPELIYDSLILLSELMQSLPSVKQGIPQSGLSTDDGSLTKLIESAKSEIQTTESMLKEFADKIPQIEIDRIRNLISGLEEAVSGNDREKIYSTLITLVDTLSSLSFGGTESTDPTADTTANVTNVSIQCPPKFVVGNELTCSFRYDGTLKGHTWTAVFDGDNIQQKSTERLFKFNYATLGIVSLNLSVCGPSKCVEADHIIEIVKPLSPNGENLSNEREGVEGEQTSDGHENNEKQQSRDVREGTEGELTSDRHGNNERQQARDVQEGTEGEQISDGHQNNENQQWANGSNQEFSVEVECNTEIPTGERIGCSFKYSRVPDNLTWSAPGGNPSDGKGDYFETSFSTIGKASITLEACLGTICKIDTQVIKVTPKQSEERSSEQTTESQDAADGGN